MSKRPPFARCGCHISSPFTEAPPSGNESSLPLLLPWVLAKVCPVLSGDADSPLPSPRRDWAKIPPCPPQRPGAELQPLQAVLETESISGVTSK